MTGALRKYLFVDRDGTIIVEPADHQIDRLDKLALVPGVIPALLKLQSAGYRLVMVTNQDGLGSSSYPEEAWSEVQGFLLRLLTSQGIEFDSVLVCPHLPEDGCTCRKPNLGLVRAYLTDGMDLARSAVVGDRDSDNAFAENIGVRGFKLGAKIDWRAVTEALLQAPRTARVVRSTKETNVSILVDLDGARVTRIATGIGYFDHMLEQLARHGGFGLLAQARGDLHVDEHHTIEDVALAIGEALRRALGDKVGIGRYGFLLPMDESLAQVSIDLSGRPHTSFKGNFSRERVGELPTELVPHFCRSLAEALGASLHVEVTGDNAHHMVEAVFKGLGRALRPALARSDAVSFDGGVPSTKGAL